MSSMFHQSGISAPNSNQAGSRIGQVKWVLGSRISIENECIYLDTKYGLFGNYVSRNEAIQLCSEYQSELLDSNQLIAYSSTIDNLIESQYQSIGSGQSSLTI